MSFLTSILTAFYFGSTRETDLFFYAIASVGIVSAFLINLDATMIIPRYMKLRESGKNQKANDLIGFIFWAYLFCMLAVAVLVFLFPIQSIAVFSKFDKTVVVAHGGIIRLSAPLMVLLTLNFFLIDLLNSFKRFSLSIVSGFISNVINISVILLFHTIFGVQSIIIGILLGNLFQFLFLLYSTLRLSGCRLWPVTFPFDKKAVAYIGYSQGAYLCSMFGGFFPLYTLSGYSSGIISALGYGQRIMDLLTFVLVVQFSNVLAIKLNEQFIENDYHKLRTSFLSIGRTALFFAIPVAVLVSVLCFEFVSVLFLRGEFSYEAGLEASRFTRIFVLIIPLLVVHTMVARLFMAAEKIDKSFGFQSIMGIMSGTICAGGIHFFGPHAFPYALLLFYGINLLSVKLLLGKIFPWLRGYYRLLLFGILIAVLNSAIIPVDLKLKATLGEVHPVKIIVIISFLHLTAFGIIAYILKVYRPFNETIERLVLHRMSR